MDLPTGTISFLFTDIEGSSRLWQQYPLALGKAVARHDGLLQAAVIENHGHVVKMRGDGLHAVFAAAQDAVAAAVAGQRALQAEEWDAGIGRMPVRMGGHSGSAQLRDGDYFGPTVNRAAAALREQIEAPMLPDEQTEYDLELAALKQALDAGTLQRAWIAGGAMDIDQAVEYALAGPNTQGR
jgi:hypothetical protein